MVVFTCVALHWLQRCCVSARRHDQVYRDDEQLRITSVHGYRTGCYWKPMGLLGHTENSGLLEVSDQTFPVLDPASWTGLAAANLP